MVMWFQKPNLTSDLYHHQKSTYEFLSLKYFNSFSWKKIRIKIHLFFKQCFFQLMKTRSYISCQSDHAKTVLKTNGLYLVSSEDLLFDLMNNISKKLQNFRIDIASPIIVTLKQGSFYTVEVSSYQDSNGAKVLF